MANKVKFSTPIGTRITDTTIVLNSKHIEIFIETKSTKSFTSEDNHIEDVLKNPMEGLRYMGDPIINDFPSNFDVSHHVEEGLMLCQYL